MSHTKERLYLKYAGNRPLYPCHNGESCSSSITYDNWHCHECKHQGQSDTDKKLYEIELLQKEKHLAPLYLMKGGAV